MLKNLDLSKKIDKENFKSEIESLRLKLGELQRKITSKKIPVIILFEGWEASGKGTLINELLLPLDPRGFKVHNTSNPSSEDLFHPYLWRFWNKIPPEGVISFFDKSWYKKLLEDSNIKDKHIILNEINSFEKQLIDYGYIIIKFFLHISKDEQKKRFESLLSNKSTAWRIDKSDKKQQKNYNEYLSNYDDILQKTDTEHSPWFIIEGTSKKYATLKTMKILINSLENALSKEVSYKKIEAEIENVNIYPSTIDRIDLSKSISKEEYQISLKKYQDEIRNLEYELYRQRKSVVIVYEGSDAAGKGGNIKRLTQNLDPRGYEVIPISAPNETEKKYHYLWRFWNKMPKAGHISIFDRSWYGRVLVERVEGFCRNDEWKRAFREINEMEEHLLQEGTLVIKFWLQIDKEEQLRRFQERMENPYKNWKITEEDWRNREKWDLYKDAVDEMIFRTSPARTPWIVVESNCKYHARIKTLKETIKALKNHLSLD